MIWWDRQSDPRGLCDCNSEVWVSVGHAYAVSNYGRAVSSARGKWKPMKPTLMASGYLSLNFGENSGLAHRIVVSAFDGPPPSDQHTDVRHLDGNKSNNELTNLRYGTRSENMLDVLRHRKEEGQKKKDEGINRAVEEGVWYGGRSWDQDLVSELLLMEAEKRLMLVDVARILDVGRDVVQNMVLRRSHHHLSEQPRVGQTKRTLVQRAVIEGKIKEGWSVAQINTLPVSEIGKPLTHQDAYYYKKKLGM